VPTRRRRRPLALIALWLPLTLLAILYSPRPPAPTWPQGPAESSLRRAFDLPAEPTLLVFHRPGGLTPADRAYVDGSGRALQAAEGIVQIYGCDAGETCVISLATGVADVPNLRATIQEKDAPDALEVYVTGAAAFAYDATVFWRRARYFILVGATVTAGLVALFGKLGPRRAIVVGVSAGSAGAVASVLAALVAPPSPVALSTVVSAGLAGAWAVRLLTPRRFASPPAPTARLSSPKSARPPHDTSPRSSPSAPPMPRRKITPLQRAIIQAGEGTLLQALIIAAGLTGFLFDYQAGLALLLGLVAAVAVSLSETPALIALLTRPRRPRIIRSKARRKWLRAALALIPAVSLLWLTPTTHPANTVSHKLEAATGYKLLTAAGEVGEEELEIGRLLPLHLLLQLPGVARSEAGLAALRNLGADLSARPAIATVEGPAALQLPPATDEGRLNPAEQTALLARLGQMAAELEVRLGTQASALSLVATDLESLDLTASDTLTTSLAEALSEASGRLAGVSKELADAGDGLIRVPTEFPELAPRMSDVPALQALPTTLDAAIADLDEITTDLRRAAAQDTPSANPQGDLLAAVQADLDHSLAVLEILATDAARLRAELAATEAMWAGAALGDAAPSAPNPYLVSHDLIRLTLIPAGDPYGAAALDEAQVLVQAAESGLAGSPLADSELALTGAPAAAATRRSQAIQSLLAPGVAVAALAVALFAWGTSSQAGPALRLAAGATLSVVAGMGAASVVLWQMDANAIALVGVALLALVGGRMTAGPVPTVETLALTLPSLSLALASVAALTAIGLALSMGLLAAHFLIAPALGYQPQPNARE